MRTRIILTHQAAESHHIGMQDGGELPLPGGSAVRRVRRDIKLGVQADVSNLFVGPKDYR